MAVATQKTIIAWMFVMVLALGAIIVGNMLQAPEGLAPITAQLSSRRDRAPASVQASQGLGLTLGSKSIAEASEQTTDFRVPCSEDRRFHFDGSIRQIRLDFASCHNSPHVKSTEILNASNGFVATVFQPDAGHLTTDYISLEKGVNRILIRNQLASGRLETREYLIQRGQ